MMIEDGVSMIVHNISNTTKDTILPTITQDALVEITPENGNAYPVSGVCTSDGDAIIVTLTDTTNTTISVSTTCSAGVYSVEVDAFTLDIGAVTVQSTIDDGVNETTTDITSVEKTFFVSTGGG